MIQYVLLVIEQETMDTLQGDINVNANVSETERTRVCFCIARRLQIRTPIVVARNRHVR
jgi:hypothetical protein